MQVKYFLRGFLVVIFVMGTILVQTESSFGADNNGTEGSRRGYLNPAELPDSVFLLPPPPPLGSAASAKDESASARALTLRHTPRWSVAVEDAKIDLASVMDRFSCAAGRKLSPGKYPKTFTMLKRAIPDVSRSTFAAKDHFARLRPYAVNNAPTCSTRSIESNSYPSGHSAVGWGMALLLAELLPDKNDQILARGRAFGESRVICNMHWLSDVEEGRYVATATITRLRANQRFRSDLQTAREEMDTASFLVPPPADHCSAEKNALL